MIPSLKINPESKRFLPHGTDNKPLVSTGILFMETWKDIIGYEGLYQVSDLGNVKSLTRNILHRNGTLQPRIGQPLSPSIDGSGYKQVFLQKHGTGKSFKIHKLVLLCFVGSSDLTVDHINEIKTDNRLINLEYVTRRENVSRHYRNKNLTSKYTGVFWDKKLGKFRARISINGKGIHLGCFDSDELASEAYQQALNNLTKLQTTV